MEDLKVKISVKVLPNDYTCDGEDRSPEIDVGGVNTGISKCLAILVNDPDAGGGGGFVHWIAWNMELVKMIPEKIPKTPHVTFPITAVQGTNSFGTIGYIGTLPSQRPDAPLLLQGLRAGCRTSAEGRRHKGPVRCRDAGPRGPVWRDVRHVREVAPGEMDPFFRHA